MNITAYGGVSLPYNPKNEPYSVTLERGRYLFELWGASGGDSLNVEGGHGAYVHGVIYLFSPQSFLIYVGSHGENGTFSSEPPKGGFNGGGNGGMSAESSFACGAGGGGSTDIRLNASIESRIIVAAGGGGSAGRSGITNQAGVWTGGYGGDENGGMAGGYEETYEFRKLVANQTYGYALLQGQDGRNATVFYQDGTEGNGGAGGGYWGGTSTPNEGNLTRAGGGGGSSFIDQQLFTRRVMINGGTKIFSPNGTEEIGHSGDGYCRITFLPFITCMSKNHFYMFSFFTFILVPFC